jgi:integrase
LRRKTLSDLGVAALKPRASRYAFPDPELRGHYVRVSPTGGKAFAVVRRDPVTGKQVWAAIGKADVMSIEEARGQARVALQRIGQGLPAVAPRTEIPDTFTRVAESWMKRHVEAKGLRSRAEIERTLNKYVFPSWKDREFVSLRRSDIATLLDRIEDEHGARQADLVLAYLRAMATWYAARRDNYVPPFIRGMRRAPPVKRDRVLTDDEICAVWCEAEKSGSFGAIVRLALLTAQRREKLSTMRWEDIQHGVWTVPVETRGKGTGGELRLPALARDIIESMPRLEGNPYVFVGRTAGSHFNSFSKAKTVIDKAVPNILGWTIHDLRRTARSLMSRAGVRPDIAERVLGHVIGGVEGVYDRHRYDEEKAEALTKLAEMILGILDTRTKQTGQCGNG